MILAPIVSSVVRETGSERLMLSAIEFRFPRISALFVFQVQSGGSSRARISRGGQWVRGEMNRITAGTVTCHRNRLVDNWITSLWVVQHLTSDDLPNHEFKVSVAKICSWYVEGEIFTYCIHWRWNLTHYKDKDKLRLIKFTYCLTACSYWRYADYLPCSRTQKNDDRSNFTTRTLPQTRLPLSHFLNSTAL